MPAATPGGPKAGEAARARAFAAIRQAILSGDLAPGRRLVEEDLAGSLGVTRQSLRAALLDLTADGLVERVPNRGARVRVVTTEEAVAITECRMALEALCAVKAAQRITDAGAAQLRELGENLKRSVADGNSLRYSELNRELHRRVGVISDQHVAIGLLDRLHGQLVRHQFQLALRPGRPEVSLAEHLAILDAVADRRPDDANLAVRAHLASVIEALQARPAGSAGRGPQSMTFPAMSSPDHPTSGNGTANRIGKNPHAQRHRHRPAPSRSRRGRQAGRIRRRHRPRGDRPQRLPRPGDPARTSRAPASPAPRSPWSAGRATT